MIKWVLRGGRGVDTDPEARVRFPSVDVDVVGLWGHNQAGGWADREALRDERGPVIRQRGLWASLVSFVAAVVPLPCVDGAEENLHPGLGRNHGEGSDFQSRR